MLEGTFYAAAAWQREVAQTQLLPRLIKGPVAARLVPASQLLNSRSRNISVFPDTQGTDPTL